MASMGPRLFRRGNFAVYVISSSPTKLQWGHAFSDVEMDQGYREPGVGGRASMGPRLFRRGNWRFISVNNGPTKRLQWGHAFSDVEIHGRHRVPGGHPSFNGATPFQTWKFFIPMVGATVHKVLQWGHAFSDVEMQLDHPILHIALDGFNGATPFQTWK